MSNQDLYELLRLETLIKFKTVEFKQKENKGKNSRDRIDSTASIFNNRVGDKLKKLKNECSKYPKRKEKIIERFKFDKIKSYLDGKSVISLCFYKRKEDILNFLLGISKPNDGREDYYALFLGYNSFEEFKEAKELEKEKEQEREKNYDKEPSPLDNKYALKEFFAYPAYLYAFDDSLTYSGENNYKQRHYPKIDALVLELDKENQEFVLRNVEGKESHYGGKIKWCHSEHINVFEIRFKKSPRDLIIRVFYPYENYGRKELKNHKGKELNMLIGKFIGAYQVGSVAVGSIILRRKNRHNIKPYNYDFKKLQVKIPSQEQKPPKEVQRYLFDRYLNWQKTPSEKISNESDLKDWLDKKEILNITKRDITILDYLIMYPIKTYKDTSYKKVLHQDIQNVIKEGDFEFTSSLKAKLEKSSSYSLNENIVEYKKYLKDRLKNERIAYYPDINTKQFRFGNFDINLFPIISRSLNCIIVVPKAKSDYNSVSSVYTIAGYCMGLKKKTFIFYQDIENLPSNLRNSNVLLNLYVEEYADIQDIPSFIMEANFLEDWERYMKKIKKEK